MSKQVTGTLYDIESSSRICDNTYYVGCLHGEEYSANAGDYFMSPDNHQFTCDCEDEPTPCRLMQRKYIYGTAEDGTTFYGTVKVIISESVTVGDLRALKSN